MAARNNNSTLPPNEDYDNPTNAAVEPLLNTSLWPGGDIPYTGGDMGPVQDTGDTTIPVPPTPPVTNRNTWTGGGADQVPTSPGIQDPNAPALLAPPDTTPIGTPPQRTVGANELVSNQLNALLSSDSNYIRRARQEGLELGGGLGGTMGIRAAIGEAIARGMPIAMADAQAYRDASAQNMDALTQFGLANIQRATQLELGVMDANTSRTVTWMNNKTQTAIARMQDIQARDIANLDAKTRVRITELNGKIQESIAEAQFRYNTILNEQTAANELERTAVTGEYNLEQQGMSLAAAEQVAYSEMYMTSYTGALDRLTALNGIDIDDDARARAEEAIWEGFYGQAALLAALYPNATPIQFEGQG